MTAPGLPSRYLNGPLPYVRRQVLVKYMLSALLNKILDSFLGQKNLITLIFQSAYI